MTILVPVGGVSVATTNYDDDSAAFIAALAAANKSSGEPIPDYFNLAPPEPTFLGPEPTFLGPEPTFLGPELILPGPTEPEPLIRLIFPAKEDGPAPEEPGPEEPEPEDTPSPPTSAAEYAEQADLWATQADKNCQAINKLLTTALTQTFPVPSSVQSNVVDSLNNLSLKAAAAYRDAQTAALEASINAVEAEAAEEADDPDAAEANTELAGAEAARAYADYSATVSAYRAAQAEFQKLNGGGNQTGST